MSTLSGKMTSFRFTCGGSVLILILSISWVSLRASRADLMPLSLACRLEMARRRHEAPVILLHIALGLGLREVDYVSFIHVCSLAMALAGSASCSYIPLLDGWPWCLEFVGRDSKFSPWISLLVERSRSTWMPLLPFLATRREDEVETARGLQGTVFQRLVFFTWNWRLY
jgi:hypothetical protein